MRSSLPWRRGASGRVEKLQPKEPQTWKTARRVGKSFANGWRFRRTSDRRQIRPRPSPKVPSSRTSFSAAAAPRTTESWDGCCRAAAGRDWSSRPSTNLLRARRERPRRRAAAEQRDELATAAHSITSSASASSVAGISRPSASAVCELITNSNLVACMTGRSAGLSPLRTRPV